jgi:Dockerin type I domain
VVSRMTHGSAGTFDVNFPLPPMASPRGVECRSSVGGVSGNYTLIFTFVNNLKSVAGASITAHNPTNGIGAVTSTFLGPGANQCTVNLSNVSNGQYITVTLNNVTDMAGNSGNVISPQMGVLIGDVNASGRVDAADVSLVRQQTLQPVTSSNFREDINVSGRIDAADVSIARQDTLQALP